MREAINIFYLSFAYYVSVRRESTSLFSVFSLSVSGFNFFRAIYISFIALVEVISYFYSCVILIGFISTYCC